jgi:hypothetical protein
LPQIGDEIKYDLAFLKSHTLQPKWFKVTKVFILLGVLGGYFWLFGLAKAAIFLGMFLLLMLIVHITYRSKTKKYTQSWLDFTAPKDTDTMSPKRIGKFYYPVIFINFVIAFAVSQMLG